MYLEHLTPGGLGLFAEEKLMPLIKFMPRRFWRHEFSRPPDNEKGKFFADPNFFTGSYSSLFTDHCSL